MILLTSLLLFSFCGILTFDLTALFSSVANREEKVVVNVRIKERRAKVWLARFHAVAHSRSAPQHTSVRAHNISINKTSSERKVAGVRIRIKCNKKNRKKVLSLKMMFAQRESQTCSKASSC